MGEAEFSPSAVVITLIKIWNGTMIKNTLQEMRDRSQSGAEALRTRLAAAGINAENAQNQ